MDMKPLVGLLALGCASAAHGQFGYGLPANVSNVRFQTLASGDDATTGASGIFVFNEPVAWENYWRNNHRGPRPNLERGFFQNWRLVAIRLGQRPTTGYGVGVQKIVRRIDKATIFALEAVPPRRSVNAQVVTSPWVLLRVERGAFDFNLQIQRVVGYPGGQSAAGGSTVRIGGATVTFGPGGGCDHCNHRGRRGCGCQSGQQGCDCGH